MQNKKRIEWIDKLRGIAFALVIVGHVSIPKVIKDWIYSYHMPLFFFITGCTLNINKVYQTDFWTYLKRQTTKLLVPYMWMQMLSFIFRFIVGTWATHKDVMVITYLKGIFVSNSLLVGSPSNPLYYVVLLFFAQMGLWAVIKIAKADYTKIGIICTAILSLSLISQKEPLILHINAVPAGMFFIFVGRLLMDCYLNNREKIDSLPAKIYIPVSGILVLIGGLLSIENGRFSLHGNYYGEDFISALVSAVCTNVAIALITMKLPEIKFVSFVGRNTLFYLGMHKPVIIVFEAFFPEYKTSLKVLAIVCIVIYVGLAPLTLFVNKFMPYMNGNPITKPSKLMEVCKYLATAICLSVPYEFFVSHFKGGILESSAMMKVLATVIFFVGCAIACLIFNLFRSFVFIEEKKTADKPV